MGIWDRLVVEPSVSLACATKPIMRQRQKTVPAAEGVVLEIGCGAGTNFGFYDPDKVTHLHALEPSKGMITRARKAVAETAIKDRTVFHEAGAEAVPVEDHSVDTAVVTFVLCTIPDWQGALREARRVLKPGGRLIYSEHGLAPDIGVSKWQRRVEPIWKLIGGGCHLTRDTKAMLLGSGFELDRHETMYLPSTPKISGFVSWGQARVA